MRKRLSLFGLHGLLWLVFFIVSRMLFLVYHHELTATLSWKDVFIILYLGMRMDAAMAAYCIILTGTILSASAIRNRTFLAIANHVIVGVFLFISCIIVVVDLELYRHWGFRMDTTPLMYIGSEGMGSINASALIGLIALILALFGIFFFVYLKTIAPLFSGLTLIRPSWALAILLVTGLLFFPIRSSLTVSPLNTGVVYFHKTIAFANHAGINVVWNFFEALANGNKVPYPEDFYDQNGAVHLLREMTSSGDTQKVLRVEKPNILLIILESFTSKVIEPLGGKPGITPALNSLVKEGILFDNFYASGDRTDKGIVSILSAYPAQPRTSIIVYANKTERLPFLSRSLQGMGYHTSFVYGGDIGFANMESYVTTAGFSHITEEDDFDSDLINSKWGVHDHHVFKRLLSECDTALSPFFKVMLSLSSHEPFDVPLNPPFIKERDEASLFLNACFYTDKSLGEFISQAKTEKWWSNTLVVITADHGHRFPDPEELNNKERFKIPMLWLGGALASRDTVIHTFGGHPDIVNTILGQIQQPDKSFKFSKDLLGSRARSFAIYVFHNGYGYIYPEGENSFDFYANEYFRNEGEEDLKFGRAYMQELFTDYNGR